MKGFLRVTMSAGLMLLAVMAVSSEASAARKVPRLLVAHGFGEDHPVQRGLDRFRERLVGVVTVGIKTRQDDHAAIRAVVAGKLDSAVVSPAAFRNIARTVTLLNLIGLWRDRAHWTRALDGEVGRRFTKIIEQTTKARIIVLGYWGGTRRHVLTRGQGIPTVQAAAKLRFLIPLNPVHSKMWKALGANPVFNTGADARSALLAGTVDGIEGSAEAMVRRRLFEVAPHLTETGHAIARRLFVIGSTAWQRLTSAERSAVTAATHEATILAREAEVDREKKMLASLRDRHGVRITAFRDQDALISRTRSIRRRYGEALGALRLLALIEKAAGQ